MLAPGYHVRDGVCGSVNNDILLKENALTSTFES